MENLSAQIDRLRAAQAAHPRPEVTAGAGLDRGELATAREHGHAASRTQAWRDTIPARFVWARVDEFADPGHPDFFMPDVAGDLQAWGSPDCAANLVLLGPTGSCKTHAAVAAARLKFDRGLDVQFVPVVELLDLLRPGGPDGVREEMSWVDVLVLDDLGAEKASEWTMEQLYAVVNRRWMESLPTVVTSNVPAADLRGSVGGRVFSRLVGNDAVVVTLAGADRRLR